MTVLTKPNVFVQIKKDIGKVPVGDESIFMEEDKVETRRSRGSACGGLGVGLLVVLMAAVGVYSGMYLFRRCLQPPARRYQGYCNIPIDTRQEQLIEPNYRVMPLTWEAGPESDPELGPPPGDEERAAFLREQLDIQDAVETVTVFDNGRETSFVHDFAANVTDILDAERCFTMDLDPELVLAPAAFVLSIEQGGRFDVTRVRSTLHAALPALRRLARLLPAHCAGRPVYRLRAEPGPQVRKRSLDMPPHDFIQFSGRRVQEIQIANMADLLAAERADRAV